ncbi:methyl-accepting chemotaxis protein [Paenibacillus montanisoli]|uniref:Methyl-accepting chemotaxis protein n=1 Tax=Paenibacillus montanisoli TaxID=2081970 RepID=A0A328U0L1_9BACL|nr:methyl-accepting chemotaxis protein [Paenibacillus montanisoli]RAP74395.1 methyl-accepting chemotaxis protein [Paenibacillus montanisoli]
MRGSIRFKLVLINSIILLLFGASTMFMVYSKIKASNEQSMQQELHSLSYLLGRLVSVSDVSYILTNPSSSNPTALAMTGEMNDLIKESNSGIANLYLVSTKDGKLYIPTMSTSMITDTMTYGSEYTGGSEIFTKAVQAAFETKSIQTTDVYTSSTGEWKSSFYPVLDNDKVVALYAIDFDVSKTNEKAWQETVSVVGIILIFLIASAVIMFIVLTRMVKPILTLANASRRIAEGDLSAQQVDVRTKDEIGTLAANFNAMTANLRTLIHHVKLNAEQVAASAEELTASAEQTSRATDHITKSVQEMAVSSDKQVASVDQGAKAIHDMSSGVQQIAASASHVTHIAAQANQSAGQGNVIVRQAVERMNGLNGTVSGLTQSVQELGDRSSQIGQFVEVITSISSQTNLLALNAAIEAARAGEHGRGFGVVAGEIRKLSEQTTESAAQIAEVVAIIQEEMTTTLRTMNRVNAEVVDGIEVVTMAGQSFEGIQGAIAQVASQIKEVSTASQDMSEGASQIVQTIDAVAGAAESAAAETQNVSAASEEQLASMQEITASATYLAKMAEELQELVMKYKV